MKNLIKERQKSIAGHLAAYNFILKDIAVLISEYDYWIKGEPNILEKYKRLSKVLCIQPLTDGNIVCGYPDFSLKIWNPDTIDTCSNVICTLKGHDDWPICGIWDIKPFDCHPDRWQEECDLTLKDPAVAGYWLEASYYYMVNVMQDERVIGCLRGHSLIL